MNLGCLMFLVALLVGPAGAGLSLLLGQRASAHVLGMVSSLMASFLALMVGVAGLAGVTWSVHVPWSVPMGSLSLALDPLSAFFVVVIATVALTGAVYGFGYLKHAIGHERLGLSWFWFNGLLTSMYLVVTARNGVLFLVAWEMMSLTSFFLVISERERSDVMRAGWIYLVATHLGTACLLAMFILLSGTSGTLDFTSLHPANVQVAGWAFVLGLIGFGTKAGLFPMHVWLPLAHPVAPSHVSAVMSGVMVKTGIYGLLRLLILIGPPAAWWGWTLIVVGAVSALFGVIMSLAQHDLKRLLAYCTVENVGVIVLGLGLGVMGLSQGCPAWAGIALVGALLHVLNHALFKGLLFFGAGSVLHATGTLQMDRLGGLIKRMPVTGVTFLLGSLAIVGLPPLNGFVSELLIYLAALMGLVQSAGQITAWAGVVVMGSLALVGGLAVVGFSKAVGSVFLGMPREEVGAHTHESTASMIGPMIVLAALCLLMGLGAPFGWTLLTPVIEQISDGLVDQASLAQRALVGLSLAGVGLLLLMGLLIALRYVLLRRRSVRQAPTWDCGYLHGNSRMQYSGSSFVDPVLILFQCVFRSRRKISSPEGLFPQEASLSTDTPDRILEQGYGPLFAMVIRLAGWLRYLQQGRNQLYILYIAVTILVLLVWKLR